MLVALSGVEVEEGEEGGGRKVGEVEGEEGENGALDEEGEEEQMTAGLEGVGMD